MTKTALYALLALALSTWAVPANEASSTEPSPAAMNFVAGFSDDHLAGMLSRFGGRDPRLALLAQVNGQAVALTLDAAIADAVRDNSAAWQRNMALAWTPLMSDDELTSLANAGAQSPHVDKYLELRGDAGQSMQILSQDLFRTILEDVLETTIAVLSESPPGTDPSTATPTE
ncbi:MAG: hypothetical protein AAFV19_06985 [Pseudomonadota bacterium]